MKTKAQERREAAKEAERIAREQATARQQAFIDRRIATKGSVLNRHTELALNHLMWPYGQPRQLPSQEVMRSEAMRETVMGCNSERLYVLMDYLESNPDASDDLEVVDETCISGFDLHGSPETFYKIRDAGRIFYFASVDGSHRMVDRQFFLDCAAALRKEADTLEAFV